MAIEKFEKVRVDGKVISEAMSAGDMVALGWAPQKVLLVRWRNAGREVEIEFKYGVLAKVVLGGDYVAVIEEKRDSESESELRILNSDGSNRHIIANKQPIDGVNVYGQFAWFEPPRPDSVDTFGVVFGAPGRNADYQLDIDATSGRVIRVHSLR